MKKFLTRVLILTGMTGLFLAATLAVMRAAGGSQFLSWHHGIYTACLGIFLCLASMSYSLRKRRVVLKGSLGIWLNGHVVMGSAGLLLVLVHAGFAFRALVPGLSLIAMVLVGLTGLFGWYMYLTKIKNMLSEIRSLQEAEEYFLAKMASSAFRFWRFVHVLATYTAVFFTLAHIVSLIIFRGTY